MTNIKFPYHEIKRVHETNRTAHANELIKSGWILLDIEKSQSGEHSYHVTYILGNKEEVEDPISDEQMKAEAYQRMKEVFAETKKDV
jgi:hypothetical protein